MFLSYFLIILLVTIISAYLWIRKRFRYFSDRQIPCPEISFPLGTLQTGKNRVHSSQISTRHYQTFKNKAPICGQFFTIKPALLVLDINLIKNILTKDFQHFHDRGSYFDERVDPLSAHLINLEGQRWKTLRAKLTPTFSSGKMKYMFQTMVTVGHEFVKTIDDECKVTKDIEIKDFAARFTTDIIGTCAFGLDCNSLKDPNVEFRIMGKKVFDAPKNNRVKMFLALSYKKLGKLLDYRLIRQEVTDFFMNVVCDTVRYREENQVKRNDFMDLLLNLKNNPNENESLTLNEIAAQAFVFFVAGFETSSTVLSFTLFELSQNQLIQDKARKSILESLNNHNGQMSYEALSEMKYLDYCIDESLRKYPPIPLLFRKCSKDYHIESMNYTIEKGMLLMIPVYAVHHDPEFYDEPEKFIPERFEPSRVKERDPFTFMPFGEGPRLCIGNRFGLQQTKIGLAMLLKNFKFSLSTKTKVPLVFSTKNLVLTPVDGIWLNVERI